MQAIERAICDLERRYGEHRAIAALRALRDRLALGDTLPDPNRYWHDLPYDDYLNSEYWRDIREVALERAGYRCQVCDNGGRLQVHHRSYERRGLPGELSDLIVLCAPCHGRFHDAP